MPMADSNIGRASLRTPRTPLEVLRIPRIGESTVFSELLYRLGNEHASEVQALYAQIEALRMEDLCEVQQSYKAPRGIHVQKRSPMSLKPLSSMQENAEDVGNHEENVIHISSCPTDKSGRYISRSSQKSACKPNSRSSVKSSMGKLNSAKHAVLKPWAVFDKPRFSGSSDDRSMGTEESNKVVKSSVVIEAGSTQKSSQRKVTRGMKTTNAILNGMGKGQLHHQLTQKLLSERNISAWVDYVGGIVIILNVIQMGVSTDFHRDWNGWFIIDGGFAVFFLLEMVTKMVIAKSIIGYFCGEGAAWNTFDAFIVLLAMIEICAYIIGDSEQGGVNFSFFRTVRLCRLARLTRLLRLSFFKELKLMVMGLFFGARTLFWSFVLVILPLYPVAIILLETLGEIAHEGTAKVKKNFETIGWSWFTIFRCIMGDCSDDSGKPIFVLVTQSQSWVFAVIYCAIIMICVFGLFNVIIAIYVENVMDAAKHNDVIQKRRRLADERVRTKYTAELVTCFIQTQRSTCRGTEGRHSMAIADQLENVSITPDVFEKVLGDPEAQKILDKLDISDEDRYDLFEILDADCSGEVEVHELVMGILKLRGSARRGDVVACRLLLIALQDSMQDFFDEASEG